MWCVFLYVFQWDVNLFFTKLNERWLGVFKVRHKSKRTLTWAVKEEKVELSQASSHLINQVDSSAWLSVIGTVRALSHQKDLLDKRNVYSCLKNTFFNYQN